MSTSARDARLRELRLLAEIDRTGSLDIPRTDALDQRDRAMIIEMIDSGLLNGMSTRTIRYSDQFRDNQSGISNVIEFERIDPLARVMGGQQVTLRISHKGRVRLAELEQALKTGRDREPFNILFGKRHILPDLIIALASTTATSPLSVAYLDANGFKAINDTINHAAGDEALRTLMAVVASVTEGRGEAYRDGGDEVVIIMPSTATDVALTTMRAVANQLHKEKMPGNLPLSISCGIVTTTDDQTDAAEFVKKADEEQKRAKGRSRVGGPRPSVIAVEGKDPEVVPSR